MSRYATIQAVAFRDARLKPRDITVLGCLGIYTDENGYCHPSLATIGRMLGISRQAVQKSVRHLEECGYLTRQERFETYGGYKRQATNLYHVNADYVPPESAMRSLEKEDEKEDEVSTGGCTPPQPVVAPPATPEVAPPATPEVAPKNNPDEQPRLTTQMKKSAPRLSPGAQRQAGADDFQPNQQKPSTAIWNAYATAYRERYGIDPIRNAKVNRQLNDLIKLVGFDNAMLLAANFPRHPEAWYARKGHDVGLMLTDAQKLLTEIKTGNVMTWDRARTQERVATASIAAHQTAIGQPGADEERF
ncbi:helix-turn-helix domain-containing protein [Candidatus Parcubacteria bacterium]|nr:MAG: helix-turn-helix domain-containing protein [Candidatus Parcubacteria bacterium]